MLTFSRVGFPIAKIIGGKYNDKIISIDTGKEHDNT